MKKIGKKVCLTAAFSLICLAALPLHSPTQARPATYVELLGWIQNDETKVDIKNWIVQRKVDFELTVERLNELEKEWTKIKLADWPADLEQCIRGNVMLNPAPKPPPTTPEPSPPLLWGQQCQNFSGTWKTSPDLSVMRLTQDGSCGLTGSFTSADGGFKHTVAGRANPGGGASITILRTDPQGCQTEMHGSLMLGSNGALNSRIDGTAGKCGLAASFIETRSWYAVSDQCPKIDGSWKVTSLNGAPADDLTTLEVTQQGCACHATFESLGLPPVRHTVDGTVNGPMTVTRTTPDGCVTNMYGMLSLVGEQLHMDFSKTTGTCNVPQVFTQKRVFVRGTRTRPGKCDLGSIGETSGIF